jgi:hypothetical protein
MADADQYHSSKSVNNAAPSGGGGYSAQRNGQRPYNPPQTNNNSNNNASKKGNAKQGNISKQQFDADSLNEPLPQLNDKQKLNKEVARRTLTQAAKEINPVAGKVVEKALKTEKGEEYLDTFAKEETTQKGVKQVIKKADKEVKKKTFMFAILAYLAPVILLLVLFIVIFAKNSDTQIYSNDNDGEVEVEEDPNIDANETGDNNVFKNYPGMYEKVEKSVKKVADKNKVTVDKYLVLATLIAPLENGLIQPIEGNCKSKLEDYNGLCYKYKDEDGKVHLYSFEKFLEVWSSQSELLSKMQILTYVDTVGKNTPASKGNFECGEAETMEQFAMNDNNVHKFGIANIFMPWTWGDNYFNSYADSELNARCISAPVGDSRVPDVRVLSIDHGTYYTLPKEGAVDENDVDYVKDPDSGGVYFWNLVNQNGFIDKYFQEYLAYEDNLTEEENYKKNLPKILEIANYIYGYYDSIRRDCDDYEVLKAEIEKIDFKEDGSAPTYTLDFEDAFVGGSVLATYGGATGEVAKAQAVLTRSEAYNYIVEQGGKVIVGSAKMGCWWWKYNPTYDPSYEDQEDNPNYDPDYPKIHYPEIYKAVTETKGIVVTEYGGYHVQETQYDAFCPTTHDPIGDFYYLPDGQNNLPMSINYFSPSKTRAECPCFQNKKVRPDVEFAEKESDLWPKLLGTPAQTTTDKCWEPNGETKEDDDGNILNGYEYSTTGGHGEGASQHGMAYFSQFGYKWDGIIGLFFDNIAYRKLDTKCITPHECNNAIIYDRDGNKYGNKVPEENK